MEFNNPIVTFFDISQNEFTVKSKQTVLFHGWRYMLSNIDTEHESNNYYYYSAIYIVFSGVAILQQINCDCVLDGSKGNSYNVTPLDYTFSEKDCASYQVQYYVIMSNNAWDGTLTSEEIEILYSGRYSVEVISEQLTYCDVDHGTSIKFLDIWTDVVNGLYQASYNMDVMERTLYPVVSLMLPNGWTIPIISNGSPVLTQVAKKKYWAVQISIGTIGIYKWALPQESVDSLWHSLLSPYDIFLDGSEYWPYIADDGTIQQGISQNPIRKFGVLSDGPTAIFDIGIIIAIIYLLEKIGFFSVAKSLVSWLSGMYWWNYEYNAIDNAQQYANQAEVNTESIMESINSENIIVNEKFNKVNGRLNELSTQIGVRLLLR